jgi:hypothetical protein
MKIRLYIVTYKRNDVLNENLRSLWASIPAESLDKVTVVANHPSVEIYNENKRDNLRVIINETRMPHAWGNLAKDWNYCLLDAFRTWENPDKVDWAILAQNDVTWKEDWLKALSRFSNFELISQPRGDQAIAFTINAVRTIGFFDERFSTLHFQEIDYYLRAALLLENKASINDDHAGELSTYNPIGSILTNYAFLGVMEDENLHTMRFHSELAGLFMEKWKLDDAMAIHCLQDMMKRKEKILSKLPREINWYPFFWDKCLEMPKGLHWYVSLSRKKDFSSTKISVQRRIRRITKSINRRLSFVGDKIDPVT